MKKLRISSHALCIFVHASEVWKNARILCLLNFSDPRKNLLARCWDIKRVNGGQPAADEVLYPGFQSYRLGLFLCTNLSCFYYNSSSPYYHRTWRHHNNNNTGHNNYSSYYNNHGSDYYNHDSSHIYQLPNVEDPNVAGSLAVMSMYAAF